MTLVKPTWAPTRNILSDANSSSVEVKSTHNNRLSFVLNKFWSCETNTFLKEKKFKKLNSLSVRTGRVRLSSLLESRKRPRIPGETLFCLPKTQPSLSRNEIAKVLTQGTSHSTHVWLTSRIFSLRMKKVQWNLSITNLKGPSEKFFIHIFFLNALLYNTLCYAYTFTHT